MCKRETSKNQNTAKEFLVATCPNQSTSGKKVKIHTYTIGVMAVILSLNLTPLLIRLFHENPYTSAPEAHSPWMTCLTP